MISCNHLTTRGKRLDERNSEALGSPEHDVVLGTLIERQHLSRGDILKPFACKHVRQLRAYLLADAYSHDPPYPWWTGEGERGSGHLIALVGRAAHQHQRPGVGWCKRSV